MMRKEMLLNKSLWDLPTSTNMTYFWNFGSMLGVSLMVQILSGILLTMFYTAFHLESFNSIIYLMKETWMGWIIRMVHMNGASMFFTFMYLHLFRGLYYSSSNNKKTWISGSIIMLMMMGISFLGYVLPWGQMSYWAVAVITNLMTVIPMIGEKLVEWIWGGYSVGKPTLIRFYTLHFLTPMILTLAVLMHLFFLHMKGSSNSIGLKSNMDKMSFHPYFTIKDLLFIIVMIFMLMMLITFKPYLTLDPVNNVPANPMQTPIHIQPEWYFLPFYAILRAMPTKVSGVLMLILSSTIFMVMSFYKYKISTKFLWNRKMIFWLFLSSFLILIKLGSLPAEEPYIFMSKLWSMIYFSMILLLNL
nr:cytochrome b [Nothopoda sp.]